MPGGAKFPRRKRWLLLAKSFWVNGAGHPPLPPPPSPGIWAQAVENTGERSQKIVFLALCAYGSLDFALHRTMQGNRGKRDSVYLSETAGESGSGALRAHYLFIIHRGCRLASVGGAVKQKVNHL
jgi:hypothetical protein